MQTKDGGHRQDARWILRDMIPDNASDLVMKVVSVCRV